MAFRNLPLLDKLRRDAALSGSELAAKLARAATAVATAPLYLRACSSVGRLVRTEGRPLIANRGRIEVGAGAVLISTLVPLELRTGPRGLIALGAGCAINFGVLVSADERVTIGEGVHVGPYAVIADTDGSGAPARPIEIGDGAWIAAHAVVLPGSRIGRGAVIAAGSVVDGEIPAGSVAVGVPARVRRQVARSEPVPPALEQARRPPELRGLLIGSSNLVALERALVESAEAPAVSIARAPLGAHGAALRALPDFAVALVEPEAAAPSFARLLAGEPIDEALLLAEVDAFVAGLAAAGAGLKALFIATWTLPAWRHGLGPLEARSGGAARALAAMNLRLMDAAQRAPGLFALPSDHWGPHSERLWYLDREPLHPAALLEAALDIKAALRGLLGGARRLVILDAEELLGREGAAEREGPEAEARRDLERELQALSRRGILLAVVGGGEEAAVLRALEQRAAPALRPEALAGWRIGHGERSRSVRELVAALNLELPALVLLERDPRERERLRAALPEALLPDWPEDPLLRPGALEALRCFDAASLSREDLQRTHLYADERRRVEEKLRLGSTEAWLFSLGTRARLAPLSAESLGRAAQLLNKTRQMNLSTRRMTEAELWSWSRGEGRQLWTLSLADRFGDAGLVGLLGLERAGERLRVVDFVLSGRALRRKLEETLAHAAVAQARALGLREVEARLLPTDDNRPCADFWERSGFAERSPRCFSWDAREPYPVPPAIALEQDA